MEQRVEEQRATLREQEEAVRSRDVQIARLEESRQISSNVLEAQRATFEERMNAAQKQLAEKMLASQVAFDAEVAKFTDSQQTLQQAHHSLKVQMDEERLASQFALAQQKLEYEAKLKEKDVQLAEREAESEALMRDSDARVGKARGALQQALQTQIAALEQQMQTLKDEKAAASLAHESLVDKVNLDHLLFFRRMVQRKLTQLRHSCAEISKRRRNSCWWNTSVECRVSRRRRQG